MKKRIIRKHKRTSTLRLLTVENPATGEPAGRAALMDISEGGAAFESGMDFTRGSEAVLRFGVGKDEFSAFRGIIRRVEDRGSVNLYGIEFLNLSRSDKKELREIIEELEEGSGE